MPHESGTKAPAGCGTDGRHSEHLAAHMTVAELMTELAKWPPDLEVLVPGDWDGDLLRIDELRRIAEGLVIE